MITGIIDTNHTAEMAKYDVSRFSISKNIWTFGYFYCKILPFSDHFPAVFTLFNNDIFFALRHKMLIFEICDNATWDLTCANKVSNITPTHWNRKREEWFKRLEFVNASSLFIYFLLLVCLIFRCFFVCLFVCFFDRDIAQLFTGTRVSPTPL